MTKKLGDKMEQFALRNRAYLQIILALIYFASVIGMVFMFNGKLIGLALGIPIGVTVVMMAVLVMGVIFIFIDGIVELFRKENK